MLGRFRRLDFSPALRVDILAMWGILQKAIIVIF